MNDLNYNDTTTCECGKEEVCGCKENEPESEQSTSSAVDTVVMIQPTLNLCSEYDIGCRIDEKDDIKICENCFYGIGFENSSHWNGANGYCPILRKVP